MRAIKKLFPKPSDAVLAMVNGIEKYKGSKKFKINMDTFGDFNSFTGLCYGCAATCAVQFRVGSYKAKDISHLNTRHKFVHKKIDISEKELSEIENAIDSLRKSYRYIFLLAYFREHRFPAAIKQLLISDNYLPALNGLTYNSTHLACYRIFANKLKKIGY